MSDIREIICAMLSGLYPDQLTTISAQVSAYYRANLESEIRRLSPAGLIEVNMLTAVINERESLGTPLCKKQKDNNFPQTPLPRVRPPPLTIYTPPPPPVFDNFSSDSDERIPLPPFFRGIDGIHSPDDEPLPSLPPLVWDSPTRNTRADAAVAYGYNCADENEYDIEYPPLENNAVVECQGCIEEQPNQQAHMRPGGCLYDDRYENFW
jgi:hypothetical protein